MNYSKITIITPNYNGAEYLEETIKSIVNQNYPNLEYIIIDGGSTDGSLEIIKKYEDKLTFWLSEPDSGLYDALQKGFSKSTGEIMGWLNSDDLLHEKSLFTVNEILNLPKVNWLQGLPTTIDEKGRTIEASNFKRWSKYDFWMGNYKWIQQESTFWKRSLWNQSGGYINKKLKLAGDMELWNRFFKYEKLYVTNALVGGFRVRSKNQLSLEFYDDYIKEVETILNKNRHAKIIIRVINKIEELNKLNKILKKTRLLNIIPLANKIQSKINKLLDRPVVIRFDKSKQVFYKDTK